MRTRSVELPILKPWFGTYHCHGSGDAALYRNPTMLKWHLNQSVALVCSTRFLEGYTSPEVNVELTSVQENPYLDRVCYPLRYLGRAANAVICSLLEDGYYVYYHGVDDYYIPGKTWHNERHFIHDGLICGYDQSEKTYSIFAYDDRWIYRVFQTPQSAWEAGRRYAFGQEHYGFIYGIRPRDDNEIVDLDLPQIHARLETYLQRSCSVADIQQPPYVYGIAVHDYIDAYLAKLIDGSVPYERMDRRVFRLIADHKEVMLKRLKGVEDRLSLGNDASVQYQSVVRQSDKMRMLYAAHHMQRRDTLLSTVRIMLHDVQMQEEMILAEFTEKMGAALK